MAFAVIYQGDRVRVRNATLAVYSRLFSAAVFRELAAQGKSPLFARLIKQLPTFDVAACQRVRDIFDRGLDVLRAVEHRDEYVYKSALTNKILLGTHSLNSASMLTEFRVGDCKADVAIFNGTSTVYEIKSERDTLSRLPRQIEVYKSFFAKVVVIAGENHLKAIENMVPIDVGIMVLSKRHAISTIREAEDRPWQISPTCVFDAIRTCEAEMILAQLKIDVPSLPNTLKRASLRELFKTLDPEQLHFETVRTLKISRDLASLKAFLDELPPSLFATALTTSMRKADYKRVISAVSTSTNAALAWD